MARVTDTEPTPTDLLGQEASQRPLRDADPVSVRDLLVIVFRYRLLIASCFVATTCAVLLWIWIRPETYEVSAKVLIKFSRDSASPRAALSDSSTIVVPPPTEDVETEAKLIESYALVEKVVTELRLDQPGPPEPPPPGLFPRLKYEFRRGYRYVKDLADAAQYRLALKERLTDREKAILDIVLGLQVTSVENSSIIEVKLLTHFKEGASVILNTLLDLYRQQRMAVDLNPGLHRFLDSQVEQSKEQLVAREHELEELKEQSGIASFDEQLGLTMKQALEAESQLKETSNDLAATKARVVALRQQLETEPPVSVVEEVAARNAMLDDLNEKWTSLELERQKLLGKFHAEHPAVVALTDDIAKVRQLIAAAQDEVSQSRTTGENPVFVDLRKQLLVATQQLEATEARYQSEQKMVAGYQERLRTLGAAAPTYNQLTREIDLSADQYRLYTKNAQEARAADAMSAGGVSSIAVVDPAVDPIVPTGVRKSYLAGGAMAAGLVLGLALAFGLAVVDHSVTEPRHARAAIAAPVLASIMFDRKGAQAMPPAGAIGQDCQLLAERLLTAGTSAGARTILFVGASEGAGTSTLVAGVADALSGALGRSTLVIEIGGVPSQVGRRLGSHASAGEATDLTLVDAATPPIAVGTRLGLIPSGHFPGNWTLGAMTERLRHVVRTSSPWEYVLVAVDSGCPKDHQLAFAQAADGVVIVVECGRTRTEVLEHLGALYARARVRVEGVVLNKLRYYIPAAVYRRL